MAACPNCGYCPYCGRSAWPVSPPWRPYYPVVTHYQPLWVGPGSFGVSGALSVARRAIRA